MVESEEMRKRTALARDFLSAAAKIHASILATPSDQMPDAFTTKKEGTTSHGILFWSQHPFYVHAVSKMLDHISRPVGGGSNG